MQFDGEELDPRDDLDRWMMEEEEKQPGFLARVEEAWKKRRADRAVPDENPVVSFDPETGIIRNLNTGDVYQPEQK